MIFFVFLVCGASFTLQGPAQINPDKKSKAEIKAALDLAIDAAKVVWSMYVVYSFLCGACV